MVQFSTYLDSFEYRDYACQTESTRVVQLVQTQYTYQLRNYMHVLILTSSISNTFTMHAEKQEIFFTKLTDFYGTYLASYVVRKEYNYSCNMNCRCICVHKTIFLRFSHITICFGPYHTYIIHISHNHIGLQHVDYSTHPSY